MRKIIAVVLAMLMVLSLASCGNSSTPAVETPVVDDKPQVPSVEITGNFETGNTGAVASDNQKATEAGIEVLKKGGNAIEAAVAVNYNLAVLEPEKTGLGGSGMMAVYLVETNEVKTIDFTAVAPKNSAPQMWLDVDGTVAKNSNGELLSVSGGMSAAVPGFVAGMETALENFSSGNVTHAQVFEQAILNASENAGLAKALTLISQKGRDGFYLGDVGEAMVTAINSSDGVFMMDDLTEYTALIDSPYTFEVENAVVNSNSTAALESFGVLSYFDLKDVDKNSAEYIHLLCESFKMAAADRLSEMTVYDEDYCERMAGQITDLSGDYGSAYPYKTENENGTVVAVVDQNGNMAVSVCNIGSDEGTKVLVSEYGFEVNNLMNNFNKALDDTAIVVSGKRVPNTTSVSIVTNDTGAVYALGASGGIYSYQTLAQVLNRAIFEKSITDAINTARVANTIGNRVLYESDGSKYPVVSGYVTELQVMGHPTTDAGAKSTMMGTVSAVAKSGTEFTAVVDHRVENAKAMAY